jgi:hypothetical protein
MQRAVVMSIAVMALLPIGCASRVVMTDAGYREALAPKSQTCPVRFFRLGAPELAYEEIGSLYLAGSHLVDPGVAQRELQRRACMVGADAVIILSESYGNPFLGSAVNAALVVFVEGAEPSKLEDEIAHYMALYRPQLAKLGLRRSRARGATVTFARAEGERVDLEPLSKRRGARSAAALRKR